MGDEVLGDLFRRHRQIILFDERGGRFFDGGVATDELNAAALLGLDAAVLVERIVVAGIVGRVLRLFCVKDVADGGLAGL